MPSRACGLGPELRLLTLSRVAFTLYDRISLTSETICLCFDTGLSRRSLFGRVHREHPCAEFARFRVHHCSKDSTAEIAKGYADRDPRILPRLRREGTPTPSLEGKKEFLANYSNDGPYRSTLRCKLSISIKAKRSQVFRGFCRTLVIMSTDPNINLLTGVHPITNGSVRINGGYFV
jgi:hypothetical protein